MAVITEIEKYKDELVRLRRDLHAHPELAYKEKRTARLVSELLKSWGVQVDQGIAETGVVGTLSTGSGPSIALRADMDALPMAEANTFDHKSQHVGCMHACGHDGHTAMLLGAAKYLAEHGQYKGTIRFIFQPAEEAAGGAKRMLDEGLFDSFTVDAVFGMHNWPGLAAGSFATCPGPMMASLDCFDIHIAGQGTHGATPQRGIDPIMISAELIGALQTVVSRNIDPNEPAVISITKMHAGDAHNVIPAQAHLGGGIRCFNPKIREILCRRIVEVAEGVCSAHGAFAEVEFLTQAPAVINTPESAELACQVATDIAGGEKVVSNVAPVMVSEDFSYMLEKKPGCFMFIGNGEGEGGCSIHNPNYDFNDDVLTLGSSYWVKLTESFLSEAVVD